MGRLLPTKLPYDWGKNPSLTFINQRLSVRFGYQAFNHNMVPLATCDVTSEVWHVFRDLSWKTFLMFCHQMLTRMLGLYHNKLATFDDFE